MMPLCPLITMEAVVCATLCLDHELFMNDTMQHKVIHGYLTARGLDSVTRAASSASGRAQQAGGRERAWRMTGAELGTGRTATTLIASIKTLDIRALFLPSVLINFIKGSARG